MTISLIVAMDRNGLIGNENGLPWKLSADLKRFRKLTTGKPIIMGRKTLSTLGRALPDRLNIVMTRRKDFEFPGCVVVHSFQEAIDTAKKALVEMNGKEIMVIGGADIFREALPVADRVYLTVVEGEFAGNAWFPSAPVFRGKVIHEEAIPADEKNPHAHRYLVLERDETGPALRDALG